MEKEMIRVAILAVGAYEILRLWWRVQKLEKKLDKIEDFRY